MQRLLTICLIVVLSATVAFGATWDGDVNPHEFFNKTKWEKLADQRLPDNPDGKMVYRALLVNMRENADIKFAEVIFVQAKGNVYGIVAYSYVKNKTRYVFSLQGSHYRQIAPIPT